MSAITKTLWTENEGGGGSHLDITEHLDGTFELGLTHVDDIGIDDGEHDGYSMQGLNTEDLLGIAMAILSVAVAGEVK